MKAILCLALLLTLSAAYYETQTQCCTAGQYWDNTAKECKTCNASCTDCDENSSTHDNNDLTGCVCAAADCKATMCDGTGCTECTDNTFNLASGACFKCSDSNCSTCPAAAATCTACKQYFALVGTACQGCSVGCSVCLNSTTCQKCKDEFFLAATICTACNTAPAAGCKTCDASGCSACIQGWGMATDKSCHDCDDANCEACTGVAATCTACIVGGAHEYVLKANGTCGQCGAGCTICTEADTAVCSACKTNYSHKVSDNTCIQCEGTCATCTGTLATNCVTCRNAAGATNLMTLAANNTCYPGCAVLGSTNNCTTCMTNTSTQSYSKHTDNVCYTCFAGCLTCTGILAAECLSCMDNYFFNSGAGTCDLCNTITAPSGTDQNVACKTCNSSESGGTTCVGPCPEGRTQATDPGACLPCDNTKDDGAFANTFDTVGCVSCTSQAADGSNCAGGVCMAGYYVSTGTNKCPKCGANCVTCTETGHCTACDANALTARGWFPNTGVDFACTECTSAQCATCSAASKCSVCFGAFYVNQAATDCVACGVGMSSGNNCATCSATFGTSTVVACLTCAVGDVLTDGSCGGCATDCDSCGDDNGGAGVIGACTTCDAQYYLTLNTCTACSANCKTCTAADVCTTCNTGFLKNSSNACEACSANCNACTVAGQCTATANCDAKYYKHSTSNDCQACVANCDACTSATVCTTAAASYYLDNDLPVTCGSNCTACTTSTCGTCAPEFYLDTTCKACGNNCTTCSSATQCSVCKTGFFAANGVCTACAADCGTCTVADQCNETGGCNANFTYMAADKNCAATITAAACKDNQYFKDNLCTDCGEKCMTCDETTCTKCEDGHGPKANSTMCSACTAELEGMKTCTATLAVAANCNSGYGLIATVCTKCTVANCSDCAAADTCATCMDGFGKAKDNKSCIACPEGCASCSSDCMRSCTKCIETGKAAPNCGCAKSEKWNASKGKCDGEEKPEPKADPVAAPVPVVSANILKFAAIVLIALIALL